MMINMNKKQKRGPWSSFYFIGVLNKGQNLDGFPQCIKG